MNDQRHADLAAQLLAKCRARITLQRPDDPETTIDRLADAIRGVASRRYTRRATLFLATAVALCIGAMAVSVGLEGRSTSDRLCSGANAVELDVADGASVGIAADSDLQLLRTDAELWLRQAGAAASVHVARFTPGQRHGDRCEASEGLDVLLIHFPGTPLVAGALTGGARLTEAGP